MWYDDLNMGGNADWAVDLNRTYNSNGMGDLSGTGEEWPSHEPCPRKHYVSLGDLLDAQESGFVPNHCIAQMTLDTLVGLLDEAYNDSDDVNNGYDETFDYYVDYIEKVVPATLTNAFMWNMSTTPQNQLWPNRGYGINDCKLRTLHSPWS